MGLELLESRCTPSTFRVNTTLDTVAVNLKTGQDASGHISLRSAIMAANANPNSDTIDLPTGTFTLTFPGGNEDSDATGDLDIRGNLTIKGKGAGATIINGNNLDRVFEIFSGKVTISGVTIENGLATDTGGGGILNEGGTVTLSSVTLSNNQAQGFDGADGESAPPGTGDGVSGGGGNSGEGGAILNEAGSLAITNCTIANNEAVGGKGGKGGDGGAAVGASGKAGANGQSVTGGNGGSGGDGGGGEGGGIFNGAVLTISGTTFSLNSAVGGLGGAGGNGGDAQGGDGGAETVGVTGNGGDGTSGNGGAGGTAEGGGLYNIGSVNFSGTASTFFGNGAIGYFGGKGGAGATGTGGIGGNGASAGEYGGDGGNGYDGSGGAGGASGDSLGGGIFNDERDSIVSTVALTFNSNLA